MDLKKEVGWKGADWVDLAEYRDRWWALMNAVIKCGWGGVGEDAVSVYC